MAHTRTWDTTYEQTPADNEFVRLGAGRIRNLRTDIRERMEIDHDWSSDDDTSGRHKKATLVAQGSDPAAITGYGLIYTKNVAGTVELFFRDSAGSVIQLTDGGVINVSAIDSAADLIVGTITVADIITAAISIQENYPIVEIVESDASVNNGVWTISAVGEALVISAVNDAGDTVSPIMTVERNATVVESVNFTATELQLNGTNILDRIFHVGYIHISTVATNPATLFGVGTWVQIARGRTLIGEGTSDQNFVAGTTGGESEHILTTDEIPAHTHTHPWVTPTGSGYPGHDGSGDNAVAGNTGSTGGGSAHNNLPPYLVVYVWERTA